MIVSNQKISRYNLILLGLLYTVSVRAGAIDSLRQAISMETNQIAKGELFIELANQYYHNPTLYRKYTDKADSVFSTTSSDKGELLVQLNFGYILQIEGYLDSSSMSYKRAIILSKKLKDTANIAYSYLRLGDNERLFGNYKEALRCNETALALILQINDTAMYSEAYAQKAALLMITNKCEDAAKNAFKALRYSDKYGTDFQVGYCYATLVSVYSNCGKYKEALVYGEKELAIWNKLGNDQYKQAALLNMGSTLTNLRRYDEALVRYQQSLDLVDTVNNKESAAYVYSQLGSTYGEMAEYKKSFTYLQKAEKLYLQLEYKELLSYLNSQLGYTQMERKQYSSAIYYLQRSISFAEQLRNFNDLKTANDGLAVTYERMGKPTLALMHYKKAIAYKDSFTNEQSNKALIEIQTKYQTEKKDLQINILKKEAEIKAGQVKRQRIVTLGSLGLALLIGTIGFLALRQNKLKQRLKMERFRNKIAADLHDDVGSTLSSMSMYSEVILKKTQDVVPELKPMLKNMSSNSREIVEAMGDIVWTINPKNNTLNSLIARVRSKTADLCDAKDVKFSFSKGNENEINIDMESAQNVYLVLKESINNALKYSECTTLNLTTALEGKNFVFEVKDNGKGFDVASADNGNGMRTMRERMQEVGGELSVVSDTSGTTITGRLKV